MTSRNAKPLTWEWQGACIRALSHIEPDGYPRLRRNGQNQRVARSLMLRRYGKQPSTIVARHTCDNKWCINPDHIILGTRSDNAKDRDERCPNVGRPRVYRTIEEEREYNRLNMRRWRARKASLLFVLLLFIPVLALASQTDPTRQELLETVKHIEALAQETQQELNTEKEAHTQTQAALVAAQQANADTQNQFNSYQKAAEAQIQKGNEAIAQLNSVLKKLHRAKWILCAIWVALVGMVVAKLPLAIKQYALIGGGIAAAAGCAFIWMWV